MNVYKKIIGIIAIILGIIALITPFTPGAFWLIFLGLELLGIHFVFGEKIKRFLVNIGFKIFKVMPIKRKKIEKLIEAEENLDLSNLKIK